MKLHRVTGKADWENVALGERTFFQKIASYSSGVLTPANIVSLLGLSMVVFGLVLLLQGQSWAGVALLVIGRLLDIVDGAVAEATGTKSPLGEIVDASFDKLSTVLTII